MRFRLKHLRLAELIAASPLSQNHWALKIGISRGHWSELVNGKHLYPSARTRLRMLEEFGVAEAELFEREPGAAPWEDVDFRRAIADRYIIDSNIGSGGMGAVYLARDVRHGRVVAVKVIASEIVSGIGLTQFQREISTVAKLVHPNILPLFDSGVAAGQPFFVMPFIREGSLRARLKTQTRLGLTEVVGLTRGITRALHEAHGEHILHCDVKPENIVLFDDHAFVTDFGIARVLRTEVGEWSLRNELDLSAGTPAYVSPEQAAGQRDLDARSDVYSTACLVFEMLAGRPPFEGTSTEQIVSRRFIVPPPPLRDYAPDVPRDVVSVLERAMSLPREQRQPTAAVFAAELETAAHSSSRVFTGASLAASRAVGAARRAMHLRPDHPVGRHVNDFFRDIRGAWRSLSRAPAFSLTVILTLAVALGANATMFGIVDHLLLRAPAHITDPDRVVQFHEHKIGATGRQTAQPYVVYKELLRDVADFEYVAAMGREVAPLGRGEGATRVLVEQVTPSFFPLLGVAPHLGRFFDESEGGEANPQKLAVVSYRFWQRHFAGSNAAIGKTLDLGTDKYTVVGVAPKGFIGPELGDIDLWIPIAAADGLRFAKSADWKTTRSSQWVTVYARLKPDASVEHAAAAATASFRAGQRIRLAEFTGRVRWDPDSFVVELGSIVPGKSLRTNGLGNTSAEVKVAKLLGGVALLVLLIACANVANLFLTRAIARRREVAVRLALGITRGRLVRQLFLEGVLLALAGGVGALACVQAATGFLRAFLTDGEGMTESPVDARLLAFTAGAALLTAVLTSLLPALRAGRGDLTSELKAGIREGGSSRSPARTALVVGQAALAVVLLVGAGLFVRSLQNLAALPIGIDANRILVVGAAHGGVGLSNVQAREMFRRFTERSLEVPGVSGAATTIASSFGLGWGVSPTLPGRESPKERHNPSQYAVTEKYFEVMGVRLLSGRTFTTEDRPGSALVAVINETAARTFWPGENPIGQCVKFGTDTMPCTTVIGVVSNTRRQQLIEDPVSQFYRPLDQVPASVTDRTLSFFGFSMVVRTTRAPESVAEPLRRALQSSYAGSPYVDVRTMTSIVGRQTKSWTLGATMFTIFGALALVLAAVGLYSTVAFTIAQRHHEFGVRLALGATGSSLLRITLARGLAPAAAGIIAGASISLLFAGRIEDLLYDISPRDPTVFAGVGAILLAAAAMASLVPAWRLRKVDAMSALRSD